MQSPIVTAILEEFLEYLATCADPNMVIGFELAPHTKAHTAQLLARDEHGELTEAEKIELDQALYLEGMLSLMRVKAMARHAHQLNVASRRAG